MKFKFIRTFFAGLILATSCLVNLANATLITFDGLPDGQLTSYDENGFNLTSFFAPGSHLGNYDSSGIGDLTSNTTSSSAYISLTSIGGGDFTLDSFDFAKRRNSGSAQLLTVVGYTYFNDGVLLSSLQAQVGGTSWVTANVFGPTVDEVRFHVGNPIATAFMLDNINVNAAAVPEPSTLAIFALGLMGLASRRFKKQS